MTIWKETGADSLSGSTLCFFYFISQYLSSYSFLKMSLFPLLASKISYVLIASKFISPTQTSCSLHRSVCSKAPQESLGWDLPLYTDPETRVWVWVVNLGGFPQTLQQGSEEVIQESRVCQEAEYHLCTTGVQSRWGTLGDSIEDTFDLSSPREMKGLECVSFSSSVTAWRLLQEVTPHRIGLGAHVHGGEEVCRWKGGMGSAAQCLGLPSPRNVTWIHQAPRFQTWLPKLVFFLHTLRNVLQFTAWFRQEPNPLQASQGPKLINFTFSIDPDSVHLFLSSLALCYFIPSLFSPYLPTLASWLSLCCSRPSTSLLPSRGRVPKPRSDCVPSPHPWMECKLPGTARKALQGVATLIPCHCLTSPRTQATQSCSSPDAQHGPVGLAHREASPPEGAVSWLVT